jgi:hypothetical protein
MWDKIADYIRPLHGAVLDAKLWSAQAGQAPMSESIKHLLMKSLLLRDEEAAIAKGAESRRCSAQSTENTKNQAINAFVLTKRDAILKPTPTSVQSLEYYANQLREELPKARAQLLDCMQTIADEMRDGGFKSFVVLRAIQEAERTAVIAALYVVAVSVAPAQARESWPTLLRFADEICCGGNGVSAEAVCDVLYPERNEAITKAQAATRKAKVDMEKLTAKSALKSANSRRDEACSLLLEESQFKGDVVDPEKFCTALMEKHKSISKINRDRFISGTYKKVYECTLYIDREDGKKDAYKFIDELADSVTAASFIEILRRLGGKVISDAYLALIIAQVQYSIFSVKNGLERCLLHRFDFKDNYGTLNSPLQFTYSSDRAFGCCGGTLDQLCCDLYCTYELKPPYETTIAGCATLIAMAYPASPGATEATLDEIMAIFHGITDIVTDAISYCRRYPIETALDAELPGVLDTRGYDVVDSPASSLRSASSKVAADTDKGRDV